ncbi:MAG: symmetrical bis(5'-nucleosyl)-tetraphosphatase [Legionellales bacterium]|nr:symmetrical bis(5'-nucleosyl)-tetraphosphatase [Legionellales bacterium]
MADYVIGDVQGCFDSLQRLLEVVHFDEQIDRLWFVGDLVNRGPDSLKVLRFIKQLSQTPRITLGNHDLHLLAVLFGDKPYQTGDVALQDILTADDAISLGHWLRQQSILIHDESLNVVMCHAGIAPMWDLKKAKRLAKELEQIISGAHYRDFFVHMYGNEPHRWSDDLTGMARLRLICNYFTRMRLCDAEGALFLGYKGTVAEAPANLYPWYQTPGRHEIVPDLVFGHWAALQGACSHPKIHALDTGCYWGGTLTALRLQDMHAFEVACAE